MSLPRAGQITPATAFISGADAAPAPKAGQSGRVRACLEAQAARARALMFSAKCCAQPMVVSGLIGAQLGVLGLKPWFKAAQHPNARGRPTPRKECFGGQIPLFCFGLRLKESRLGHPLTETSTKACACSQHMACAQSGTSCWSQPSFWLSGMMVMVMMMMMQWPRSVFLQASCRF